MGAGAGAEVQAADAVRGRCSGRSNRRRTRTSRPRIWRSTKNEEPSADEEVDLATGDDDLGVGKAGEDDEG